MLPVSTWPGVAWFAKLVSSGPEMLVVFPLQLHFWRLLYVYPVMAALA
jgi:hypothetical protein